ncbi:MBL fold metallo-hydrolase [Ekhidna sp. MALMAid0563]|uniref:ComEC/Rec2 family competence protein n=1 Tax=Ekhidna sp. MALMAid0563 TaxID=3143937 RepID=UPI0032DE58B4
MKPILTFLLLTGYICSFGQELEIIQINIGQGNSTLILGPEMNGSRTSVLYDCGQTLTSGSDKDGGQIIYDVLRDKGVSELDYLVISHYDADHLGGLIYGTHNSHRSSFSLGPNNVPGAQGDDDNDGQSDWLDNSKEKFDFSEWGLDDDIKINKIIDRGDEDPPGSATFRKFKIFSQAVDQRISIIDLDGVQDLSIDLGGGATIKCLAGNGYVLGKGKVDNAESENERSIAFLVEFGAFDYLIGGDLIGKRGTESGPEDARLEYYVGKYLSDNNVNIDVLAANHHGANNTSELSFLNLIKAEYAIISTDENSYGHPHPDHLERLLGSGVMKVYQTNKGNPNWPLSSYVENRQVIVNSHIVLTTDGVSYSINGDTYVCDN